MLQHLEIRLHSHKIKTAGECYKARQKHTNQACFKHWKERKYETIRQVKIICIRWKEWLKKQNKQLNKQVKYVRKRLAVFRTCCQNILLKQSIGPAINFFYFVFIFMFWFSKYAICSVQMRSPLFLWKCTGRTFHLKVFVVTTEDIQPYFGRIFTS